MKDIKTLFRFEKFWIAYTRQNRGISKWDKTRTDMEVFINRTIGKWFVGKFFQIQTERHSKMDLFLNDKPLTEYKIFTKYVYITNIKFAFAPYHDLINFYYIEPHSEKIEKVAYGWNDFMRIKLIENEGDFRVLKKFYPINIQKHNLPTALS